MAEKSLSNATSNPPHYYGEIFGPAPLFPGEDEAAYNALLAEVSSAVNPTDIIEDIFVHDLVDFTWEILRYRRHKATSISRAILVELEIILGSKLKKRSMFPEAGVSTPQTRAARLVKRWTSKDPVAVKRVEKILASENLTLESVTNRAFERKLEHLERVDRLVATAEGRRNLVLREIDRHRATQAQRSRDTSGEFEDAKCKIVNGKIGPPKRLV